MSCDISPCTFILKLPFSTKYINGLSLVSLHEEFTIGVMELSKDFQASVLSSKSTAG